mmetsp:Transcript_5828/g.17383  ORF Transcript_5828/g.17383 Transcript_5828/m.17383 type:complete len:219 (+) Transcript_5828:2965-3621(+)
MAVKSWRQSPPSFATESASMALRLRSSVAGMVGGAADGQNQLVPPVGAGCSWCGCWAGGCCAAVATSGNGGKHGNDGRPPSCCSCSCCVWSCCCDWSRTSCWMLMLQRMAAALSPCAWAGERKHADAGCLWKGWAFGACTGASLNASVAVDEDGAGAGVDADADTDEAPSRKAAEGVNKGEPSSCDPCEQTAACDSARSGTSCRCCGCCRFSATPPPQ